MAENYLEELAALGPRMTSELFRQGGLLYSEVHWRDRYLYLKERGYVLRQRYRPDWIPSWLGTNIPLYECEDAIMTLQDKVIDASRPGGGYRVSIKVVSRATDEAKIACLLSSKELASNPNNHCVPILEVLPDPVDAANELLVMPYLLPFYDPPFETVEELMDFIRQTLQGLAFIHENGVAHRDCSTMNIMMDGRILYPEDHHPISTELTLDTSQYAKHRSRSQYPVKYYYIDFGMSSYFRDGELPYVLGAKGADQDAPELSNTQPYNAFMLDVFILGHMYETQFLKMYLDLDFLVPLVSSMMHEQPERRPTAEAALRMFHEIYRGLNATHRRWRLRKRDESGAERVVYDTISAAKVGFGLVRRGLIGS